MVSKRKRWAGGLPPPRPSLSARGGNLAGRGGGRPFRSRPVPAALGLRERARAEEGRARVGCAGLRWAVALDSLFAPRPGGLSQGWLGLAVPGAVEAACPVRVVVPGLRRRRWSWGCDERLSFGLAL